MGKISTNNDLMKLAGAQLVKSPKTGHNLLVFDLDDGSTRLRMLGKRDGTTGVYCNLDIIPNATPNQYNEDTHWVAQQTTKEERAVGFKLPSIGGGREWPDRDAPPQPQQQSPQRQNPPPQQRQQYQQPQRPAQGQQQAGMRHGYGTTPPPQATEAWDAGLDGDDVPF